MAQTKNYQPQVAPGNDNLTGPSTTVPTLTFEESITLTFPYDTPTITLVLRCPEFNNKEFLHLTRIVKLTRGNELIVKRDQNWPRNETLSMSFTSLKEEEKTALLNLFDASLGLEIGLLDHEGRQWKGIFTSFNEPVLQDANCSYSAEFSFQGYLV